MRAFSVLTGGGVLQILISVPVTNARPWRTSSTSQSLGSWSRGKKKKKLSFTVCFLKSDISAATGCQEDFFLGDWNTPQRAKQGLRPALKGIALVACAHRVYIKAHGAGVLQKLLLQLSKHTNTSSNDVCKGCTLSRELTRVCLPAELTHTLLQDLCHPPGEAAHCKPPLITAPICILAFHFFPPTILANL